MLIRLELVTKLLLASPSAVAKNCQGSMPANTSSAYGVSDGVGSFATRPKITVKRVSVRFATVTKKNPQLAKGKTKVLRAGVAGINELTYTDAKLTRTKVIKKPVAKLVAVGTRTAKPWITPVR